MQKKIDPTERALDAYFELDTDQMAHFHAVIRYATRAAQVAADRSVDYCKLQEETKRRGRPPGSKNRNKQVAAVDPDGILAQEFLHNNGTAEEGL